MINKPTQNNFYDYIYMFVMVIYMAQATPETSRMVGGLSGNPVPLILPMVMTLGLFFYHKINLLSSRLVGVLLVITLWAFLLYHYKLKLDKDEMSFMFFLYYAIIIAYIHVQVFGKNIFTLYERIIVILSAISIPLWLIGISVPVTPNIYRHFEETGYGNNVFYIFTWMDPLKGQIYGDLLRNAGCSWEPGRFAIMVVLGIYCNLCINGIKFKGNYSLWILFAALASTQSTTGYVTVIFLYVVFYVKRFNLKYLFGLLFIGVPLIFGLFQLDFMQAKIQEQLDLDTALQQIDESVAWDQNENSDTKEGEYTGSLGRFASIYFEATMNIPNDPLLGYGRNRRNSYFYNNYSSNLSLTGGLLKQISMYGFPLGILFYIFMFISSYYLAKDANEKRTLGLVVVFIGASVSYPIFSIPIFTAFWMYGIFRKNNSSNKVSTGIDVTLFGIKQWTEFD